MDRLQVELDAPGFGRAGTVIRYGHWGRPVLVFPSERGRAWDWWRAQLAHHLPRFC
jgi:esterase/lipase superfamily enzyme